MSQIMNMKKEDIYNFEGYMSQIMNMKKEDIYDFEGNMP